MGNPGPGGYGAVLLCPPHRKELSAGYRLTTNNRMELLAVIVALEALKFDNCQVTVYSDSQYVVKAIEQWLPGWVRTNFKNKKNVDLWQRYIQAAQKHNVKMVWIKGHNQTPENERCDLLANTAAKGTNLLEDTGYVP